MMFCHLEKKAQEIQIREKILFKSNQIWMLMVNQ